MTLYMLKVVPAGLIVNFFYIDLNFFFFNLQYLNSL